jgi:tartrate dehydratase alpha subunit/fumarate hydratase class I-like protein
MGSEPHDQNWETLSHEILTGMREWRLQHPKATLREIELALDAQLSRLRARMLQDVALQSVAADWKQAATLDRPTCQTCGTPLILRGKRPRQLNTHGGQQITLNRSYGLCPTCKKGLFPPR